MLAVEMLQQMRPQLEQPAAAPAPVSAMTPVWGTEQPKPLNFGGRQIDPKDPMYLLIQQLILDRYKGPAGPNAGNQG